MHDVFKLGMAGHDLNLKAGAENGRIGCVYHISAATGSRRGARIAARRGKSKLPEAFTAETTFTIAGNPPLLYNQLRVLGVDAAARQSVHERCRDIDG
jgi:hypothetical protein